MGDSGRSGEESSENDVLEHRDQGTRKKEIEKVKRRLLGRRLGLSRLKLGKWRAPG